MLCDANAYFFFFFCFHQSLGGLGIVARGGGGAGSSEMGNTFGGITSACYYRFVDDRADAERGRRGARLRDATECDQVCPRGGRFCFCFFFFIRSIGATLVMPPAWLARF